jgi:hypothetical protein
VIISFRRTSRRVSPDKFYKGRSQEKTHLLRLEFFLLRSPVPTENSVQPMADVIPSNRTANLEQFAALLESGEPNSPMHACAMEHSSDRDFKAPRIGTA